ncbi:protein-L-isoaspartate(D-aspartate) O-methyltransferase [Nonomuraea sp. K274]|uniref:Protein-L-isoaspartate O-methyltransferase n=1 Tax=Nonomuraea cypriaca TaxID=1187855 RepID=A0A931F029_9ACTN|nr:protein-L-isoaspartate(D-aspartate) O-methyltransferase [Nonomuraea cypriaca]MBF8188960.1 protein-L-isoaspartate(D-aspartate) O-methyltransferase [Nonomuraea cypriaca]
MIDAITDHRPPVTGSIEQALRAVPRHWFVPPLGLALGKDGAVVLIDRDTDPPAWWDAVYGGRPIVTQLDAGGTDLRAGIGRHTCRNPAPSEVADLLELLGAVAGQRLLEIGTSTGWTAGLLCRMVGGWGSVTSVEADPAVAEQAAKNLAAAGAHPYLIVGDGAGGCPERAPYDGVNVTQAVRTVPYAWVEQSRPGAVIVAPYVCGSGHAVRLEVLADGTARGRFMRYACPTTTAQDGPPGATLTMAILAEEWAGARATWVSWGEPGRERFGMTVTAEGQRVWLDDPERVVG